VVRKEVAAGGAAQPEAGGAEAVTTCPEKLAADAVAAHKKNNHVETRIDHGILKLLLRMA